MADNEPDIVQRVRRRLEQVSMARAISFAVIAAVAVWLAISLGFAWASWSESLSASLAASSNVIASVAAVLCGVVALWLSRKRDGTMSPMRAALWLEEQVPSLHFALATLTDVNSAVIAISPTAHERLVAAVGKPEIATTLQQTTRSRLAVPLVGAVVLLALAMPLHARLSPESADAAGGAGIGKRNVNGVARKAGKALSNWKIRVVPPAYSGIAPSTFGDIGLVNALVGSAVEVSGDDDAAPDVLIKSITDTVKPKSLSVTTSVTDAASVWRTHVTMPNAPAEVRFTLGTAIRQLLLEPRVDSLPVVRLQSPRADSVYRVATGSVTLDATAHDDFGLSSADFELIVTSGEGERFTAKTVMLAAQKLNGEKDTRLHATMSLDTMKLEAGDIVHMRAVARDRHPDAAREAGTSETRTFRIARPSEYDSVAVEPAPPPEVQKSLMSQRMLLIMTEKLEVRRPRLSREVLVRESRSLAAEQSRLRKTVGDLVFQRLDGEDGADHTSGEAEVHGFKIEQGKLVPIPPNEVTSSSNNGAPPRTEAEGDESPLIGVNKPLLEAYNAMWDAASALDVADPKTAIPHMKLALAAIERARSAERIYLRGKPPVVIIDVNKIRLAGKDTGQKNERASREAISPREAERESRLLAAALLMSRDVAAARDSLAFLRLETLTDAPRLAAALNDALEVARRGGDITNALIRARRLISGGTAADSLSSWRGLR